MIEYTDVLHEWWKNAARHCPHCFEEATFSIEKTDLQPLAHHLRVVLKCDSCGGRFAAYYDLDCYGFMKLKD